MFNRLGESISLRTPTRTGFTFDGWYTNEDLTGSPVGSLYTPSSNVTLYAKWKSDGSKITLPYIINQKYGFSYNGQSINLEGKCAGVCAMDISMYYQNIIFSGTEAEIVAQLGEKIWKLYYPEQDNGEIKCIFDSNDYLQWGLVKGVNFNTEHADDDNDDISDFNTIFNSAVENIISGTPMMIYYYDITNKKKQHWVIPVSYSSKDMSIDSLTVADPYTRDSSYVTRTWTLKDSIGYNFSMGDNFDTTNIRYRYVTSSPATTN